MANVDNTGASFVVAGDDEATRMWQYGLLVWRLPGVRETCLDWQVRFGFDVTFLIFLSWVGCVRREAITCDQLRDTNAAISEWRQTVIEPARAARKYVKANGAGANPEATAVFELLRAVELRSELREQAMLLQWWRAQERVTACDDGFLRSVRAYLSTIAPAEDGGRDEEVRRICGLVAGIEA